MAFFTTQELDAKIRSRPFRYEKRSASVGFSNEIKGYRDSDTFDVFLSHRKIDYDRLLALKDALVEDFKLKVYVDHVQDPFLDRENVTKATAELLRKRMRQCRCLFFATTENSPESKWMPWELGFFDALTSKVAVLPVLQTQPTTEDYKTQEYLGLYPYVIKTGPTLYLHESAQIYVSYARWLEGAVPTQVTKPLGR